MKQLKEWLDYYKSVLEVAFTPKGGCLLKRRQTAWRASPMRRSIHPQGWVPVETLPPTAKILHIVCPP